MAGTGMKLIGKLFSATARAIAIRGALDITAVQAHSWIMQATPVDTGRLKRSYRTRQHVGKQYISFSNNAARADGVEYFPFVEHGTRFMKPRRMVASNMPRINDLLARNLAKIPRWL